MHYIAMKNGEHFFNTYAKSSDEKTIVDIGAQDVNGSLRTVAPPNCKYVGVDFQSGKGVDVILSDPYVLPFEADSIDFIVSSSCFEHSEMFWLTYLEIIRILKPAGVFYLNAPSMCHFHRYPVDCYRFYPDSGVALANWGRRNGYRTSVIEHYTTFTDYVCVTIKDEDKIGVYPKRITENHRHFAFAARYPDYDSFLFPSDALEDRSKYAAHFKNA